jgi:hypothetical protein
MNLWAFLAAALLLSLERLFYIWVSRTPSAFRAWCDRPAVAALGEPVEVLQKLFYGFKALQGAVFFGWCYWQGNGTPGAFGGDVAALGAGVALLVVGQLLNMSVFYRLGKVGVFYGNRLGYELPWCRAFPFSWLKHPQYVGTVLAIWGLFLIVRFPHDDWYVLPALETVYYAVGAYFEQ